MAIKFSVEDIRNHLSELGYNNVPEQKLNTFVSDLKRLIRYEEKRRDLDKKLDILDTSVKQYPDSRKKREKRRSIRRNDSSTDAPEVQSSVQVQDDTTDAPDGRINASIVPNPRQRRTRITAGLEKTTSTTFQTTRSHMTTTIDEGSRTQPGSSSTTTSSTVTSIHEQLHHTEQSSLYVDIVIPKTRTTEATDKRPGSLCATLLDKQSIPNSGVIRCRSTAAGGSTGQTARRGRSDPVRLHTEYRKAWDKLNLPGETSHNKLRWAVRGWMMGEEPV